MIAHDIELHPKVILFVTHHSALVINLQHPLEVFLYVDYLPNYTLDYHT